MLVLVSAVLHYSPCCRASFLHSSYWPILQTTDPILQAIGRVRGWGWELSWPTLRDGERGVARGRGWFLLVVTSLSITVVSASVAGRLLQATTATHIEWSCSSGADNTKIVELDNTPAIIYHLSSKHGLYWSICFLPSSSSMLLEACISPM